MYAEKKLLNFYANKENRMVSVSVLGMIFCSFIECGTRLGCAQSISVEFVPVLIFSTQSDTSNFP